MVKVRRVTEIKAEREKLPSHNATRVCQAKPIAVIPWESQFREIKQEMGALP